MLSKLSEQIIEYAKLAGEKGYTPGISGNISARCDDKIIITSSGSANAFLSQTDLSVIDFDGNVLDGCNNPSSEKGLHIEYYKQRDDIHCVFHLHSPYLTAFAFAGIPLDEGISPEIIYCFGSIPIAQYALPGSELLVKNTSIYFKDYDVVLMENHGVVVGGKSVKDAFLKLDLAEGYAKTILCAKILGGAKILKEEEVKNICSLK